jgi:D-alanyl-lipoteichoic acid acyltransferase DltB (MBOAT superfamily)
MTAHTAFVLLPLTALLAAASSRVSGRRARQALLLTANAAFLITLFEFSARHVACLYALVLMNIVLIRRAPRAAIALDLGAAALLYGGAPAALRGALRPFELIGFSFLLLKLLHAAIDAAERALKELDALDFLNYALFFPCFSAGPIDRYQRFARDAVEQRPLSWKGVFEALERGAWGLLKAAVLAPFVQVFSIDHLTGRDWSALPLGLSALALYAYGASLYLAFSGFSDLAVAAAALLGFDVPENFDNPFSARNIQDFWGRWHMTLTGWLKDYVFFPVGRAATGPFPGAYAPAIAASAWLTFVAGGLWHGARWHFLAYGAYHGAGFLAYRAYAAVLPRLLPPERLAAYERSAWAAAAGTFLTFNFVSAGWILFSGRGLAP